MCTTSAIRFILANLLLTRLYAEVDVSLIYLMRSNHGGQLNGVSSYKADWYVLAFAQLLQSSCCKLLQMLFRSRMFIVYSFKSVHSKLLFERLGLDKLDKNCV